MDVAASAPLRHLGPASALTAQMMRQGLCQIPCQHTKSLAQMLPNRYERPSTEQQMESASLTKSKTRLYGSLDHTRHEAHPKAKQKRVKEKSSTLNAAARVTESHDVGLKLAPRIKLKDVRTHEWAV